eukprot:CAMPEP_0171812612 /NCGR_PEP_ID=MMETSP0991-20121206/78772_1 /TAXON_ID=483369 /ORGANISM="non described non described, Strain CCMP2098" /LENGTH=187 /DNA_ID=CAMNT_0012426133 /DNA_START=233 /DNA_END=795 /DNA_ORIENTATION=+
MSLPQDVLLDACDDLNDPATTPTLTPATPSTAAADAAVVAAAAAAAALLASALGAFYVAHGEPLLVHGQAPLTVKAARAVVVVVVVVGGVPLVAYASVAGGGETSAAVGFFEQIVENAPHDFHLVFDVGEGGSSRLGHALRHKYEAEQQHHPERHEAVRPEGLLHKRKPHAHHEVAEPVDLARKGLR